MTRYLKFILAAAAAAIAAVTAALTDDVITNAEWVLVGLAALNAVGVYVVPNFAPAGEPHRRDLSEQG